MAISASLFWLKQLLDNWFKHRFLKITTSSCKKRSFTSSGQVHPFHRLKNSLIYFILFWEESVCASENKGSYGNFSN